MGASARSTVVKRDHRAARPAGFVRARWAVLPAIALALIGLLSLPMTGASGHLGAIAGPALPVNGGAAVAPTLSLVNDSVASTTPPSFWGANVRPYYTLGTDEAAAFGASGLQFVRWPGGAVVDRFNVSANLIYNDNATSFTPAEDVAGFSHWCASVACVAIVGLPAEINSAATAAYYVHYIEHVVGFVPAYWEIGNEPAVWTHFGSSWAHWTTSQAANATPSSYAQLVHRYIAAVRAVDPSAKFVGLGGLGTGGYGETTWIRATVQANGANLSAISIHVYPAGGSTPATVTAPQFYATLNGPGSLSVRVPADRAAIAAACRGCDIAVVVSELGSGTDGGPFDAFMSGFPDVPYIAAEYAQALALNVTQVDLYALEGTYDGSIMNETGQATLLTPLFHSFLAPLRGQVLLPSLTGSIHGAYLVATRAPVGGATAVLIANTNSTSGLTLQLQTPGGFPGAGSFTSWGPTQNAPSVSSWGGAPPSSFHLGPEGVGLIVLNGGIVWQRSLPTPPSAGSGSGIGVALALPPATVQGILGLAAPTSLTFPCWAVATARRRAGVDLAPESTSRRA